MDVKPTVRKVITYVEELEIEGQIKLESCTKKAVAAAVLKNPYAGKYQEDLSLLFDMGEELGYYLAKKCLAALGIEGEDVNSYGKAAIVGENGEIEHGAALLHPKMGRGMRGTIGGGKAIIPSTTKSGGMGTSIDVPLHYKDDPFVFSHCDSVEIRIPDAPKSDEIVLIVAFADSGRPLPRVGGRQIADIKREEE